VANSTIIPSLRGHYAGFVTRTVAFVLDVLLVVGVLTAVMLITQLLLSFFGLDELARAIFEPDAAAQTSPWMALLRWLLAILVSNLAFAIYVVFFWLLVDKTMGQALLGLRVVRVDGRSLKIGAAFRRVLGMYISILPLFLGFLWVLVDDRRQGWHDKIADTVVVYDWEARLGRQLRDWLARRSQR
jgi:uncharacterized RDD family membrane protein YckC